MAHAIFPVAVVLNTFAFVDVLAFTVSQAVQDVSLIGALIGPGVLAATSDLVLLENTIVDSSVSPLEDTLSPKKTKAQVTSVLVAIFELACSVAVVDFADL